MQINFDSETPIYMQIAEQIEDAILSGAFAEESQVPSTTEISVTYQINPATVLKGMNLLVDAGVLYKKRGLGMFVCKGAANGILQKRKKTFYDGFVVRLLQEAEKNLPNSQREWFYQTVFPLMEENMLRVKEDLDWLIAKYDYRNAGADWKTSRDALQRTIQKLSGIHPSDPPYKNE